MEMVTCVDKSSFDPRTQSRKMSREGRYGEGLEGKRERESQTLQSISSLFSNRMDYLKLTPYI